MRTLTPVPSSVRCGPIFGAGADLCISDRCDSSGESYSNLPHSYDGEGASSALLFGDYSFNVADYEVFTLAGGARSPA